MSVGSWGMECESERNYILEEGIFRMKKLVIGIELELRNN